LNEHVVSELPELSRAMLETVQRIEYDLDFERTLSVSFLFPAQDPTSC